MAQKKNDRVILHCDMNGFYASVELLTHPELRDRPMAVSGDPDNRHGIILAKNQLAKEKGVDLALVAGTGPKGRITLEDVEAYLTAPKANEPAAEVKTSPLAAKLAEELGVDVSKIQTDGRVMKADVLAAAGVCTAAPTAEAAPAISAGDNDEPPVKVNPLRRSIAANMANSWHTSPRVT